MVWSVSSWWLEIQLDFSSRVRLLPFLHGQFSELWQLTPWLQSGYCVVNVYLVGVSVSTEQLTGHGSEHLSISPWEGTEGSWLCLMTKLLLFYPVWLLSFAYAFSHFSDSIYSSQVFARTKGRQRTRRDRTIGSYAVSLTGVWVWAFSASVGRDGPQGSPIILWVTHASFHWIWSSLGFWIKTVGRREVRSFTQGHAACKQHSWDLIILNCLGGNWIFKIPEGPFYPSVCLWLPQLNMILWFYVVSSSVKHEYCCLLCKIIIESIEMDYWKLRGNSRCSASVGPFPQTPLFPLLPHPHFSCIGGEGRRVKVTKSWLSGLSR